MSSHHRTSGAYSRRDMGLLTMAGLANPFWMSLQSGSGVAAELEPAGSAAIGALDLGVGTSSFRDLPRQPGTDPAEAMIQAMTACDVHECELCSSVIEPAAFSGGASHHHAAMSSMKAQMMRRELRKWRLRTPMSHFESIGSRFREAGVRICAYRYTPDASFSDEEIDRGFSMAKALGAEILTTSMSPDLARRAAPFADKHQMVVAFTGRSRSDASPLFKIHADIGQLTADNIDAVSYIRDHHAEVASVCLADRRKGGEAVPWGHGDAPIREVLHLLERERWPIRAYVEYQYRGEGTAIEEVRKCLAYAKQALS